MALTPPDFPAELVTCNISVDGSAASDVSIAIQLTAEQAAAWSDDDLERRTNALRDAVGAFCSDGTAVQTAISWSSSISTIVRNTSDPVPMTPEG